MGEKACVSVDKQMGKVIEEEKEEEKEEGWRGEAGKRTFLAQLVHEPHWPAADARPSRRQLCLLRNTTQICFFCRPSEG